MRESHTPRLAILGAACLIGLTALASGENQLGEHLPPKAKVVAQKFELYQKTASTDAVETKRRQVIDYLRELLNIEASAANLDGALAVKALIERLERERAGSQERAGNAAPAARPVTSPEGLLFEEFSITSEAGRHLEFPFVVSRDGAAKSIRCEITGAGDDSGDRGLEYELVDPRGKVVKQGFLDSSGTEQVVHDTRIGGEWRLVIVDADTDLDGEFPGNHGTLRISVVRGQAALASNRQSR
jgi:hypothetical protein